MDQVSAMPAIAGPATVLVVDDNDAKRYVTTRWLRRAGYSVVEAATGREALERAGEAVDLVILDVRLPDLSGFEVCRRLKSAPATAHLPVLHLSAHVTTSDDRAAGLDGGADGYLTHPVASRELIATAEALLRVRRAEAALRVSEERLRLVAKATNDAIWDWNLGTDEVVWNAAAGTLFRRDPADVGMRMRAWRALIHPSDRERVESGVQATVSGGGELWTDQYRLLRGDGTWAAVYDRGFVVHDDRGRAVRMIGSMLDVTERTRSAEEQLLLSSAGNALAESLDADVVFQRFAEVIAGSFADLCVIWRREGKRGLVPVAASGPSALADDAELLLLAREAGERGLPTGPHTVMGFASAIAAPLLAHEQVVGAFVLCRRSAKEGYAVTDLPFAAELGRRAGLAIDHADLYENAVLANRVKSDFLAVMSHELRTPLNAIVGYADLLAVGVPAPIPEASRDFVDRVKLAARHLLGLIDQILTFSRMEAGREQVYVERIEVMDLVAETAALIEPLALDKGLEFRAELLEGTAGTIESDCAKVRQILLNLLSNAVKFTEAGGVAVEVRASEEEVAFTVLDSGIGIAPEHLEHVFQSFWQVEQKKTRRVGGSGLGLAVSRRLARLLGGDVTVESVQGTGSRFTLRLPRRRPSELGETMPPDQFPMDAAAALRAAAGVREPA